MNNRKIPFGFFLLGIFNCLIRYFLVGVIGFICFIIGLITRSVAIKIGLVIFLLWISLSVIEEIRICNTIKTDHSNEELNGIFDKLFGEEELMKQVLYEGKEIDILKEMKNNKKGDEKDEE